MFNYLNLSFFKGGGNPSLVSSSYNDKIGGLVQPVSDKYGGESIASGGKGDLAETQRQSPSPSYITPRPHLELDNASDTSTSEIGKVDQHRLPLMSDIGDSSPSVASGGKFTQVVPNSTNIASGGK